MFRTDADSSDKEIHMRFSFKPVAIVFALVALLAFAPAAMARGGGGGGGGGGGETPCATIDTFTMSGVYVDGQPSITWAVQTTNLCIDEFAGSTALDFSNAPPAPRAVPSPSGAAR